MNKLNFYKHSGHCYPELVEKCDGKVVAQINSTLWRDDYNTINDTFLRVLKEPLKDGIKILLLANITFDPAYGLALRILDIDPGYTLGDLEREKQETIRKLQEENIFTKNKALKMSLLPKRIAIISVETSKGYADFLKVIDGNPWNYKFFHHLFPSLLQGERAVEGIIGQLRRIRKVTGHFDVVAIIRGGGGDVGLSCYNHYRLSREIALFPIPVITGIGHATNETVAEMTAHFNAITPTKLAEYLLQRFHDFSIPVQRAEEKILDLAVRTISDEKGKLRAEVKLFRSVTANLVQSNQNDIKRLTQSMFRQTRFALSMEKEYLRWVREEAGRAADTFCHEVRQEIKQLALTVAKDAGSRTGRLRMMVGQSVQQIATGSKFLLRSKKENIAQLMEKLSDGCSRQIKDKGDDLDNIEKNVINMSPENIMKRGYSMTLFNGKPVKDPGQVREGDVLNTLVPGGSIVSIVKTAGKTDEQ